MVTYANMTITSFVIHRKNDLPGTSGFAIWENVSPLSEGAERIDQDIRAVRRVKWPILPDPTALSEVAGVPRSPLRIDCPDEE